MVEVSNKKYRIGKAIEMLQEIIEDKNYDYLVNFFSFEKNGSSTDIENSILKALENMGYELFCFYFIL